MKKIYLCGKVTGLDAELCRYNFEQLETLVNMSKMEPVNPMKLDHNHDKTWESYMKVCIKALVDCDAVLCMANVKFSKGAKVERRLAYRLGIPVLYLGEWPGYVFGTHKLPPQHLNV